MLEVECGGSFLCIVIRRRPCGPPVHDVSTVGVDFQCNFVRLTAHVPAALATIPPLIIIGFTPFVLLKIMPLNAPAIILFVASSVGKSVSTQLLIHVSENGERSCY
jgi:hypothetical protein